MPQQSKTLGRSERKYVTSHVCECVYVKCSVKCYPMYSIRYLLQPDISTGRHNEIMYVYVKHHKEKQMCKSLTVKHTKNTNSHVFEFVTR